MAATHSAPDDPIERQSLASLLSRLIGDASALFRSEVALAKAEITQAATDAKLGAAAMGIALVILLAGTLSLVAALILGLAVVIAPWLAALIVGVALSAIGVGMLQVARRKIKTPSITLERTKHDLRADAAVLARRT
jgi:hypothetical protein